MFLDPPGSVMICMDPDLDSDPDSSVNKQTAQGWGIFLDIRRLIWRLKETTEKILMFF